MRAGGKRLEEGEEGEEVPLRGGLTDGNECEVEHTPDYVEAPAQAADTRGRDLNDHEVEDPTSVSGCLDSSVCETHQFVAVPSAAPLVRIAIELISVG
jgi:hypothetical protein